MADTLKCPDIPEGQKLASQVIEKKGELEAKRTPPKAFRYRFQFEEVNEVTLKLANGEISRVPASHGQWGGYNTTKSVAWVMCVAPRRWLARCGDEACGPDSLNQAKANALAMAKGAPGDYQIANPISHLNGMTARLLDMSGASFNRSLLDE